MIGFTSLERAALQAIFAETPELSTALARQLDAATVTERENTGGGFFTTIEIPNKLERVESPRVLGHTTYARIIGMQYGLGFVLFMEDGYLHLLEGYSCGGEDTTIIDLDELTFQIAETPFDA